MPSKGIKSEDLSGPRIDRRTTVKLLGTAGFVGLAGCSSEDDDGDTGTGGSDIEGDDLYGGTLRAGWNVSEMELDPHESFATQEIYMMKNIFSGLLQINEDLEVVGDIATDWTVSDGGATYTFSLRDDVTFHNGEHLTAEDVAYSIRRIQEEQPPVFSRIEALLPHDEGGVEVVDDYTIELNLENPFVVLPINLTADVGGAGAIVNQTSVEELGDEYNQLPVGTGPFEVVEHTPGNGLRLEAFDDYFEEDSDGNQLPYLDAVDVDFIVEDSTRVTAMQAGDLDFASLIPAENADELDTNPDVNVFSEPDATFGSMHFNVADGPFSSHEARLGLSKVIDRDRYIDETFFGRAEKAEGPLGPAVGWAYREDKPDDQAYDPEAGRELLEQEGLVGEEFELIHAEPESRAAEVLANIIQQEAGIDIALRTVDPATYQDLVPAGDFNIALWGSSADPDPDMSLYDQFGPPETTTNWFQFENEEVFGLLDQQRQETDQEARKEILWEIEDFLIENAIAAFLDHQEAIAATSTDVNGFNLDIPMVRNFHTTWLES